MMCFARIVSLIVSTASHVVRTTTNGRKKNCSFFLFTNINTIERESEYKENGKENASSLLNAQCARTHARTHASFGSDVCASSAAAQSNVVRREKPLWP